MDDAAAADNSRHPGPDTLTDRRDFLRASAGLALAASVVASPALVWAAEGKPTFDSVYANLTSGIRPEEGRVTLEMPEIAENGNTVPFTVDVEIPMTAANHVRAVHVLSTENPQALVATFRFGPLSGKASVAGRMRLAKTQPVVVLAELSDGTLLTTRRTVKVTIGGCGT